MWNRNIQNAVRKYRQIYNTLIIVVFIAILPIFMFRQSIPNILYLAQPHY